MQEREKRLILSLWKKLSVSAANSLFHSGERPNANYHHNQIKQGNNSNVKP